MTEAAPPPPPESAFDALLPDDPATPVVVSVPHAGTAVAGYEATLARTLDVRCDADLWVDRLYDGLPRGAFIRARLSRFVCDLNRHPDDVSAAAVPEHPAPRNADGRGFLWAVTTTGAPALARPLTLAEWQERRAVHAAYHGAITAALDRAQAKFGFAVLVDGHSMPSAGKSGHTDSGRRRADVVPGDRRGGSCTPALSRLVAEHFAHAGYSVAPNDPYQGGFITAHHGNPASRRHAIQIELRRDLYMNEDTFAMKPDGLSRLRATLAALLSSLDSFDPRSTP